jgi:hypothetical protein
MLLKCLLELALAVLRILGLAALLSACLLWTLHPLWVCEMVQDFFENARVFLKNIRIFFLIMRIKRQCRKLWLNRHFQEHFIKEWYP